MIRYILLSLLVLARTNWVLKSYEGYDNQFQDWIGGKSKSCDTSARTIYYIDSGKTEKTFQIDLTHISTIVMVVIETINDGSEVIIQTNNRQQEYRDYNIIYTECLSSFNIQRKQVIYIDMTQEAEQKINVSLQSQGKFALNQVHIFGQECRDGCLQCLIKDNYSQICLICQEGYIEQISGNCLCLDYKFEQQCVKQCPLGTFSDNNFVCLKGETTLIETRLNVFPSPFVKYTSLNGTTMVGIFGLNEKLKIQFDIPDITQLYYFEAVLYIFDFQNFTELLMKIDDELLFNIYIIEQIHAQNNNGREICDFTENCQWIKIKSLNTKFQKKKIELIIGSQKMAIISQKKLMQDQTLNWGIKNLELKQISFSSDNCQTQNCADCLKDYYECSQCQQNYVLLQNTCVTKCSSNQVLRNNVCIDFSEEIPFTEYLVKKYYEPEFGYSNEQLGEVSLYGSNQLQDYLIEGVSTFGGIWNVNEFSKIFYLDPHYALTLKMKIRFVDFQSSSSTFMYQIDGGEEQYVLPIRNSYNEGIGYIDQHFLHNYYDIQITFGCKAQGYCYISNYFFMIHKCHPYCLSCTGPNIDDCSKFKNELISFNSQTLSCNPGYYLSKESTCNKCLKGCLECSSEQVCLACSPECPMNEKNKCRCAQM